MFRILFFTFCWSSTNRANTTRVTVQNDNEMLKTHFYSWSHGDGDGVAGSGQWMTGDRAVQWAWRRRSQGRVMWMLGKQTLTHESVERRCAWYAESQARVRRVNCDWVVNKCTYWCIIPCVVLVTVNDIHGHSSQQNTLRGTPSTAREARAKWPREATTSIITKKNVIKAKYVAQSTEYKKNKKLSWCWQQARRI